MRRFFYLIFCNIESYDGTTVAVVLHFQRFFFFVTWLFVYEYGDIMLFV